ncbi:hypothetical protein J3R75_001433 [Oligosphaera ethanolica]|uniref:Uncharacterized protein n=1 Tax=Oligosphaera ethanolica TaxID=760260 RepID=A0AAE3VFI3_9BACT|nr:hypothetical protein [Oligosphaera ethanolica]
MANVFCAYVLGRFCGYTIVTRLGTTRHNDIDSLLPHNWTPARN